MPLSSALRRAGIDLSSDCDEFWLLLASHMRTERDKETCVSIGHRLKSDYFVLFVQQMLALTEDEISSVLISCGGKKRWIKQIETLLDHRFRDLPSNAPPSAHLVDNGSPEDNGLLEDKELLETNSGSSSMELRRQKPPPSAPPSPSASSSLPSRGHCQKIYEMLAHTLTVWLRYDLRYDLR